jgi:ketosteroid isomerase-like protein
MLRFFLFLISLLVVSGLSAQNNMSLSNGIILPTSDSTIGSVNLQVIRKINERSGSIITAFRESGIASPDMEWWVIGPKDILSFSGTFLGLEGVAEFQKRLNASFRYDKVRIVEYIDGVDQIGVIFEGEGVARMTERPFRSTILRLFTFHQGKVIKVRNFFDTDSYTSALQGR